MKVIGGKTENGIVVGNTYDKYSSTNPIVKFLMKGFTECLEGFVAKVKPTSIYEVGCGEGYWTLRWLEQGFLTKGSDFSSFAIDLARKEASLRGVAENAFEVKDIYDLSDCCAADLIVCCEVLEHLERPDEALKVLHSVTQNHIILSVPREPLWSYLNLARGRYFSSRGNTPGHIQRWSKNDFVSMALKYFNIREVQSPIPWTMLLCSRKMNAQ